MVFGEIWADIDVLPLENGVIERVPRCSWCPALGEVGSAERQSWRMPRKAVMFCRVAVGDEQMLLDMVKRLDGKLCFSSDLLKEKKV